MRLAGANDRMNINLYRNSQAQTYGGRELRAQLEGANALASELRVSVSAKELLNLI